MENLLAKCKSLDELKWELHQIPNSKIAAIGKWTVEHKRGDQWLDPIVGYNLITTVGLNYMLNVAVGAASKEPAWYIGLIGANITPSLSDVAATALGGFGTYGELGNTHYNPQNNRPAYQPAAASGGVITNSANKAEFTFLTHATVYGGFLVSSQAKQSTTGILLSARRFDTPRAVITDDVIYITYDITLVNS